MRQMTKFLALGAFFIAIIFIWFIYPATGVPILAYHMVNYDEEIYSISPDEFDQQMQYLEANGYTAISLSELFAARDGKQKLPDKPIIITFDDGYADNLTTALPIMEKHGLKGTVFVISGSVGQETYLTWEQIKEMQARHTEIGSHTANHVDLNTLTLAERENEVKISKETLEQHLQTPIEFLAYPYGQYDAAMADVLQKAGYRGACTGQTGFNINATNPYMLKRVNVPRPKYGLWEFKVRLFRAQVYAKLGK